MVAASEKSTIIGVATSNNLLTSRICSEYEKYTNSEQNEVSKDEENCSHP